MKSRMLIFALSAACSASAAPLHAQDQRAPAPSPFVATLTAFSNCMKHAVQMGMITKMDPAVFKEGLAKGCKAEETQFRIEGIKEAVRQGRTEAQATQEIDNNIANGRRIFAADQETYITTGRVPH